MRNLVLCLEFRVYDAEYQTHADFSISDRNSREVIIYNINVRATDCSASGSHFRHAAVDRKLGPRNRHRLFIHIGPVAKFGHEDDVGGAAGSFEILADTTYHTSYYRLC